MRDGFQLGQDDVGRDGDYHTDAGRLPLRGSWLAAGQTEGVHSLRLSDTLSCNRLSVTRGHSLSLGAARRASSLEEGASPSTIRNPTITGKWA